MPVQSLSSTSVAPRAALIRGRRAALGVVAALALGVVAAPGSQAATIATGEGMACGVAPAGAVSCWGSNADGALGNGGDPDVQRGSSHDPVAVIGAESGVTAISSTFTGGYGAYTCAIQTGAAKCWGANSSGTLGDGTTQAKAVATQVSGLTSGVTDVSTGAFRACAVQSGAAKCWGGGFLGDGGGNVLSTVPKQVSGFESGAEGVGVGWRHLCAIKTGTVSCWGATYHGAQGNGAPGNYTTTPSPVTSLPGPAKKVVAGLDVTCALLTTNAVWCWGSNSTGRVGIGTTSDAAPPTAIAGLQDGVTDIAANQEHSCAIKAGLAYCWGTNDQGQLGDGTLTNRSVPTLVSGISNVTSIAVTASASCAIVGTSERWCWGSNGTARLGNEAAGGRSLVPVPVVGASPKPPAVTPPAVVPPAVAPPTVTPRAKGTIKAITSVRLSGKGRQVTVASIACPTGATCTVTTPRSVTFKLAGRTVTATVSAGKTLKGGKKLSVRVTFSKALAAKLKGRSAKLSVRLSVLTGGVRVTRQVSTTVRGAAAAKKK
jgi:alpha-tubulin suppressor-like RCC1 family protein